MKNRTEATRQEDDEYLTVSTIAKIANLGTGAVYDRIESGELPAYRFGTSPRAPIRVKRSDLMKAMVPVVPKGRK